MAKFNHDQLKKILSHNRFNELSKLLDELPKDSGTPQTVLDILYQNGLSTSKHSLANNTNERKKCLDTLVNYFENADKFSKIDYSDPNSLSFSLQRLVRAIEIFEIGYFEILEDTYSKLDTKLTAKDLVASIFGVGNETFNSLQNKLHSQLMSSKLLDILGEAITDEKSGKRVSFDLLHQMTINMVGDSLQLTAYKEKLFNNVGEIVLPNFELAMKQDTNQIINLLLNSRKWKVWETIEEDFRFFRANIEEKTKETIPNDLAKKDVILNCFSTAPVTK